MEGAKTINHKVFLLPAFLFSIILVSLVFFGQPSALFIALLVCTTIALVQHPVVLLFVLVASIPWSIEHKVSSSLATDLPDEPLMLLLSFAVVIVMVYKYRELRFQFNNILFLLLGIQLLWTIISVLFSSDSIVSLKYLLAKTWYLLAFLVAPVLFLNDKKQVKQLVYALTISMVVAAFVVLARHYVLNFSFADVNKSVYPFFRNHVNYSALLVLMIPVVFATWSYSKSKAVKIIFSLLVIVLVTAVYFSYARGAWLALVIGLLSFFLLKKRLLFKAYLLSITFFVSAIIYLVNNNNYLRFAHDFKTTIYHEDFKQHLVATYQLKDVSSAERFYRWIAGVRMIKDFWATGSGPNTFYPLYKQYTAPAFRTWVSENEEKSTVHNYFLLMIIEQGIIGLVIFLLLLGVLFYKAENIYQKAKDKFWKICAATIAVILTMICTVNFLSDLIETDKIGSVFYLCIAILIIADAGTKSSKLSPNV